MVSLENLFLHSGSIRSTSPLTIETSQTRWGHAVSLPLVFSDLEPHGHLAPRSVAARVTVERGELGIIVVNDDLTTILGPVPPPVGNGTHTLYLTWNHLGHQARLVFRNTGSTDLPCVFQIESVELGSTPRLLHAPSPWLQYVTGPPLPKGTTLTLPLLRDSVSLHNQAQSIGDDLEFVSDPFQWGYSLSVPIGVPLEPDPHSQPLVGVGIHVLEGAVGVGMLDHDMLKFVTSEVDVRAASGPAQIELRLASGGIPVRLMIRNTAEGGNPSRFKLLGITLQSADRNDTLLAAKTATAIVVSPGNLLHHSGSIRSTSPLTIETSQTPWEYAVSVPLVFGDFEPAGHLAPFSVAARVTVERGELGIVVVNDDGATVLGPVPPAVGNGTHTLYLTWNQVGHQARLVFRNTGSADPPCVFQIESIHVGSTPPLLNAPATRLQYVTGPPSPNGADLTMLFLRDSLSLHNQAQSVGDDLEFVSDPFHWGYSVSVPIDVPLEPDPHSQPLVVVGIHVLDGAVGIGVLDDDMLKFATPEVDVRTASEPVRIELRLASGGIPVRLMIRNAAEGGNPSRFKLLGITLQSAYRNNKLLAAKTAPAIAPLVHSSPAVTGVFDILISHSSRHWVREQCDREYLRNRWGKPGRLDFLRPFHALPPHAAPYYGLLSVFRIELSTCGVTGRVVGHYISSEKVVHAAVVSGNIVVAFDDGVGIFARADRRGCLDLDLNSGRLVTDPWFGGLHTVIPVDDNTCLLSGSGADAVLWLDTRRGTVTRRWRLPEDRYGLNYDLDATTWLAEHYIPNEFQLGHLNCAAPDGSGGVFVSVLGPGDIGHLSASGEYQRLATDYVGCHGVRFVPEHHFLYFSDSCSGRLMRVDGPNEATTLFETGSLWLHDSVRLTAGLFLMTVADRNSLMLADVEAARIVAEWDFGAAEGTVQFLSVAAAHRG